MYVRTMLRRLICLPLAALALVVATTEGAVSQTRTVTGRVTSGVDGTPLSGVNVQAKGGTKVVMTDASGRYSVEVSGGSAVLVFSYAGFETREAAAEGRTLDVVLSSAAGSLNEVVVTALGITREEKSLGYSVGKVKGDAMRTVTQENAINALAGRVAGVTVNQIGGVGSSTSIVIRGATSLTSDNQPLFVIDGVPVSNSMSNMRSMGGRNEVDYGNPISDLNPEDIENITVLKGPSAAALYGSRAGNGVIIVTTKKGRKGEALTVNFSSSNVFEAPYRYLDFHYKYSNGNRVGLLDERSAYWAGIELDKGIKAVQWNSPVDPTTGAKIPTEMKSYRDNMKNFLETGITSTNALSVSGSSDRSTYRLSYTNMTHKGMIPNSDLFRHNLAFTSTYDLSSKLRMSLDVNLSRSKSNDRPKTGNRGANEVEAIYNWSHVNVLDMKSIWAPGQEGIQQLAPTDNMDNPYFIAYGITNAYVRDRVFGNVKLEYNFSKALSSHLRLAYDTYVEDRETKIPWSYTQERRGAYHLQDLGWGESNVEFMTNYRKKLGDFSITASAGGNVMMQQFRENYVGSAPGVGLVIPNLYRISNITAAGIRYSNSSFEKAIYSAFATASAGWRDQVYLDVSARNDWSSTLPASNRSYFYPSASLSWLASSTFRLPKMINLLKLRAGWAQVGNDTNPYALEPVLGTDSWGTLVFNSYPGTLLNPNLKPEINTSQEFGIDLAMFNNRLRIEGTYFQQQNTNQILNIQSPASTGFSAKQINAGVISSRGLELMVSGTPIKSKSGFTWDISANVTRMRTRLESLTPGMTFITLWDDNNGGAQTFVGEDIGNLYSRGYQRVTDPKSPYYNWPILTPQGSWIPDNTREGRMKVGNFNPDAIVGIQSSLRYKRWTLNTSFDWRIGGQYQSFTYRYGGSDWKSQLQIDKMVAGGLLSTADLVALLKSNPGLYIIPQNGNFPRVGGYTQATGGFPNPLGTGTNYDGVFIPGVIQTAPGVYVEHLGGPGTQIRPASNMFAWSYNQQVTFDADFLKLREFSIGYDLPKVVKGVRNINLAVFTRNLILWTKDNVGIDPERAFQVIGGKQGDTQNLFRQGIELQNVIPWTMAAGVKLNVTF